MIKHKRFYTGICLFFFLALLTGVALPAEEKKEEKIELKVEHPAEPPASSTTVSDNTQLQPVDPKLTKPSPQLPDSKLNLKPTTQESSLGFDKTYHKRVLRALIMGAAHFAYATSSYWIRQEVNAVDWEYHFNWKEQSRRIFKAEGIRFDSNSFPFNWTHSMAGSMYYNYARTNHLSKTGSLMYTFICSGAWETFVEFKEVISINDMITTPFGGATIGESIFQIGRYYRSQKPTIPNVLARIISNPIMAINDFLDRNKGSNQYSFGTENIWHDFRFTAGPRFYTVSNDKSRRFTRLALDNELILLPEYQVPGEYNFGTKDTYLSEFNVGATFSGSSIYEANIFARSVLFGHFWQKITTDETKGYSLFIGGGSAFDLVTRNTEVLKDFPFTTDGSNPVNAPSMMDKYTIIDLIGPTLDYSYFNKKFKVRFITDIYGSFGLIYSQAFEKYKLLYPFQGATKSTLEDKHHDTVHGYYYGLGLTLSSKLHLNYSNLELKGKIKYMTFSSIDGRDRYQKEIPKGNDFHLTDQRMILNLSLGYRIPSTPLQVSVGLERINRWGKVENYSLFNSENRSFIQLECLF